MKFGKTAQLLLAIGIFAIGAIFLYRMNLERQAVHEELDTQLAATQLLLPKLSSDKEELESRLNRLQSELAQAETSLGESKAKFPASVENIDYVELLFEMAQARDLELMSLTTSGPVIQVVEDIGYEVTSFNLEVKGKVSDILDLVNVIATDEEFTTATVELVAIKVPEPLTSQEKEELAGQEQTEEEEPPEAPSAIIKLDIYSYEEE